VAIRKLFALLAQKSAAKGLSPLLFGYDCCYRRIVI
jgi:hypothetical protein